MKLYSHAHGQQKKITNSNIIYSAKLKKEKEKELNNCHIYVTRSSRPTIHPKTVFHKNKNKYMYIHPVPKK